MKIISGKKEIIYLLSKVIEKYELETGERITRNSNRRNYDAIAIKLSDISNQLPYTSEELQHDVYSIDPNPKKLEYPFRKYDITGNQIKDSYFHQIVSNPRNFLVDACYVYLFGLGRKGFQLNPTDNHLIETEATNEDSIKGQPDVEMGIRMPSRLNPIWIVSSLFFIGMALFFINLWWKEKSAWETVKEDMNLLPYQPTKQEISQLEGIWLCYTGSPQARPSDPERFHKVVRNLIEIKYKNGYFMYNRFGASFNHTGYAQFEAPGLVSIHSHVKSKKGTIESPRHSLLLLNDSSSYLKAISASWNFDFGLKNKIIGIREVYIKVGKGGEVEEIINSLENGNCKCKIIQWNNPPQQQVSFYLKNELLDSLKNPQLSQLIGEESILQKSPEDQLLLKLNH